MYKRQFQVNKRQNAIRNIFAMEVLAPEERFKEAYDEFDGDSKKLQKNFGMNKTHVGIRASMLDLEQPNY